MTTNPKYNILILGKGYIGNKLHRYLKNCLYDVDIKSASELNYHDGKTLNAYLLNNGINTVINCSGFTGKPNVDQGEIEKELCWDLNTTSPLRVNRICHNNCINYMHISTGCVYNGYEKNWTEEDSPNFGLFQNHSSFYSKSKHAFEIMSADLRGIVLRIRMPFDYDSSYRNYLNKIKQYDNLLNLTNSKTYVPDLCRFIQKRLTNNYYCWSGRETYNVVNPEPLKTEEICEILKTYGQHNSNWTFTTESKLKTIACRSNCVLDSTKANSVSELMPEWEAITECCKLLKCGQSLRDQWQQGGMESEAYLTWN